MSPYHLLFLSILNFFLCPTIEAQETSSPNIVWILAEDLSPDLACYGHPLVHTPHLDALAAKGVKFTQVFSTAPVCSPSRTALATGMYQTSLDAHHMRYPDELKNRLPSEVIPLNELMRHQGYQTANIKDKVGKGKTDWSFYSEQAPYDVEHWDALDDSKPFFAVVNLRLTHRPFERDTLHPIDPQQVSIPPYYPDHPVSRADWAAYLETVQVLDRQVGQVLNTLQQKGWEENTLIFFFSDHGRPMSRAKNYLFGSGNHIPLIVYAPENLEWRRHIPAGTTNDRLISSIDITATTLALTGAKKPTWMQGRVLLGPAKEADRSFVFSATDRIGGTFFKSRSVRNKQFNYIRNFNRDFSVNSSATAYRKQMHPIYHLLNIYDNMGELTPEQRVLVEPMKKEMLYDLEADPHEIHNLAKDPRYKAVLKEMRQKLAEWQEQTIDYGMRKDSKEIIQVFRRYREDSHKSRSQQIHALETKIRNKITSDKKASNP